MKKIYKLTSIIALLIIFTTLITGCESQSSTSTKYKEGTLICSRQGNISNATTNLNYIINYKNGNITVLRSIEEVLSDDKSILDTYENAYTEIFKPYKDLEYYENTITRSEGSVISNTLINYEKIDIEALLDIEGEEDNIIEDGKAKLEIWLSFAEKFGTTCEEA